MDAHATQLDREAPKGGPLKFAYASGSRPLDGFTIKRGIGRGGFGEVYFAVSDGGKEVALKLVRHNLDVELRGVAHCLNLKHPNLIALYDVKQDDQDNHWVVMEFATGESLEEVIRRHPQGIPSADAHEWMQGIAAGVSYLHDHGIVHRDLKPGNIFRDEGVIKLGDYGLAKFISCSRRSGQTESVGTVHYMAPEVANGRYGKEIDIYALGIILYEMLTGRVPFEGESIGEVLMKHLTAEPSLAAVPEAYRQTIARALAKDPAVRFASVAELIASLPLAPAPSGARLAETRAADGSPYVSSAQDSPALAGPVFAAQPHRTRASAPVDEEPIWRAVRDGWRSARDSWDGLSHPTKVVAAVLGCAALAINAEWVLKVGTPLVLLYIFYRIIRSVVLHHERRRSETVPATKEGIIIGKEAVVASATSAASSPAPPQQSAAQPATGLAVQAALQYPRYGGKRNWRQQAVAALVVKPLRERLADLTGSMILAALVGTLLTLVVVLLRGDEMHSEQLAWLTIVSVVGSWAVLIPSKFWEGATGDQALRRLTMLTMGLGVGAVAYLAAAYLTVNFPDSPNLHIGHGSDGGRIVDTSRFFDPKDGSPLLYAYLSYFGAMFAVVRWWKQSDPLRRTRLSVGNTAGCVLAAWLVDWIWAFPQPWGLMFAAIVSTSVQLVSPFVGTQERSS